MSSPYVSNQAIELLKKFEGFRSKLYYCSAGKATIGYGHVVLKSEPLIKDITEVEAQRLLYMDIAKVEKSIMRNINTRLSQCHLDALTLLVFNIGVAAFQRSTLRQKINKNDFYDAISEFERWVYVAGRKIPGLVIRRKIEARIFQGDYPKL